MIANNTILSVLVLVCGISFVVILIIPFSIAFFYGKIFTKRVYPFLFVISVILFALSFLISSYDFFSESGSVLFAAGGVLLAVAGSRLYFVMMGRR